MTDKQKSKKTLEGFKVPEKKCTVVITSKCQFFATVSCHTMSDKLGGLVTDTVLKESKTHGSKTGKKLRRYAFSDWHDKTLFCFVLKVRLTLNLQGKFLACTCASYHYVYNVIFCVVLSTILSFLNYTRGKEILEQLSKPSIFTEFENRGLFSTATQQGRKGRDFQTLLKNVALRVVLISLSL